MALWEYKPVGRKHSRILAWVRPAGISLVASLTLIFLANHSCSTTKKDESNTSTAPDDSDDSEYDDDYGDDTGVGTMQHPRQKTHSATITLLTVNAQPPAEKLTSCSSSVMALTKDAYNQSDMVRLQADISSLIKEDKTIHHWCFYHMAVALEQKLNQSSLRLEQRADKFFNSMKTLWIFARAMDKTIGTTRYFDYIRTRYITLSREYFGRELQITGSPIDEAKILYQTQSAKPAGKAPVDP